MMAEKNQGMDSMRKTEKRRPMRWLQNGKMRWRQGILLNEGMCLDRKAWNGETATAVERLTP